MFELNPKPLSARKLHGGFDKSIKNVETIERESLNTKEAAKINCLFIL
jgi:hypothetical protein